MRPGRERRGPAIGVVLDTSSSMLPDMDVALAALRWIVTTTHDGVRLIQCDGSVRSDCRVESWRADAKVACSGDREMVLMNEPCTNCGVKHVYRIDGADTDLSDAMEVLERDPSVDGIVVLTDGYVRAPTDLQTPVLWVLTGEPEQGLLPSKSRVVTLV